MKSGGSRPNVSSYSVSEGESKSEVKFRDNSYLHDKAD
jgi:hypothetical protein